MRPAVRVSRSARATHRRCFSAGVLFSPSTNPTACSRAPATAYSHQLASNGLARPVAVRSTGNSVAEAVHWPGAWRKRSGERWLIGRRAHDPPARTGMPDGRVRVRLRERQWRLTARSPTAVGTAVGRLPTRGPRRKCCVGGAPLLWTTAVGRVRMSGRAAYGDAEDDQDGHSA